MITQKEIQKICFKVLNVNISRASPQIPQLHPVWLIRLVRCTSGQQMRPSGSFALLGVRLDSSVFWTGCRNDLLIRSLIYPQLKKVGARIVPSYIAS